MAMSHGCKLASDIIRTHFGEMVEKVCQCLVYRGPLFLAEIARFSEMNPSQLKNSLLVLVQHNCVQGYRVEHEGGATKVLTSYLALIDNILHRMRFPKFLVVVRDELGGEAESLLEGLLEHGRLTLEQIIQRAAARQGKGEADVETLQKQTFAALVRARYIERCPASEPILASKDAEPEKKAQRGSIKSKGKKDASKKVVVSEEVRVVAAAAPLDTERFRMPVSLEGIGETATDDTLPDPLGSGVKRKRDALTMEASTLAVMDEKEVLWRANYEELIRKLRYQACVTQAQSRVDAAAGTVLEAMLESSRPKERGAKQQFSIPLSMSVIMEAVARTPAGRTMTYERVKGALQHMAAESTGFLTRSGENYLVNMQTIIESAQRREVEAIVLQRFGRDCCRIYRLLTTRGQMEQKQIAGMAMIQVKEARVTLYNLLKEKYVEVQEIAKTAEHAAQKSFYLWNVNWQTVKYLVLDDMYHAAANLGQRLAHELQQEQEVLDLLKQIQAAKAAGSESHVTLTQRQHEQVKRIRRVATVLETSLLHLDDALLLFRDF